MKQADLFLLFENNSPDSIFEEKKNFFVILCFILKSSMASFLKYILDSIYVFKVVDFNFVWFAQAGLVFVA